MKQAEKGLWKSVSMVQPAPHIRVIMMAPTQWPTEQEIQRHIEEISRIAYLDQVAHATRAMRES